MSTGDGRQSLPRRIAEKFSMRRLRYLSRRLLRALGKATGTSHQIALGVGIGFFVAWLPIIGIQMVVSVIICQILGANKVVPIFPVWLTNPVTFIPVYSVNYWVGWKILGGPPLSDIVAVFRRMLEAPDATGDGRLAAWWEGVRHGFSELLSMGWNMLIPLCVGSAIVGLALAFPSYFLTRKFVDSFREAVKKKTALRRELRRRKHIEAGIGGSGGLDRSNVDVSPRNDGT